MADDHTLQPAGYIPPVKKFWGKFCSAGAAICGAPVVAANSALNASDMASFKAAFNQNLKTLRKSAGEFGDSHHDRFNKVAKQVGIAVGLGAASAAGGEAYKKIRKR